MKIDLTKALGALLLSILTGISAFGVETLSRLTDNVGKLNEQMAVVLKSIADQQATEMDHENRLRVLELNRTK